MLVSEEIIDKVQETLPGLVVVEPFKFDNNYLALCVGDIVLAKVLPETALMQKLPWLEYVVPDLRSDAVVYIAYDLYNNSLMVVYKTVNNYIYEYLNIVFEDFAELLMQDSLGAALRKLVKGASFIKISTPTQLLKRLN